MMHARDFTPPDADPDAVPFLSLSLCLRGDVSLLGDEGEDAGTGVEALSAELLLEVMLGVSGRLRSRWSRMR